MTPTPPEPPRDPRVDKALSTHAGLTACDRVIDEIVMRIRGLPRSTPRDLIKKRLEEHNAELQRWRAKRAGIFNQLVEVQKGMKNPPVQIIHSPKVSMKKSTSKLWAHFILIGLACATIAAVLSSFMWLARTLGSIFS